MRIGMGYDVHPLKKGRRLIIGGVDIPYELGLDGHSDADVLIHAIIDAMFGAANLGTIGEHFPDTDQKYKNIDSKLLLKDSVDILIDKGYFIKNIDCIIVTQKPKLIPYLDSMKTTLAKILNIEKTEISIKAKREEGLGFTGRSEGIKAYSVILIDKGGEIK